MGLKDNEELYFIPNLGVDKVIVEIKEKADMSTLPALTNEEEEVHTKPPSTKDPNNSITTEEEEVQTYPPLTKDPDNSTTDEEGETHRTQTTTSPLKKKKHRLMEDLSFNAITTEGDSTILPTRHYQQGEEAKTWTSVPLLQRVSSSNE